MIDSIVSWIALSSYSLLPAFAESLWRGLLLTIALSIVFSVVQFSASKRHLFWFAALAYISLMPFIPVSPEMKGLKPSQTEQVVSIVEPQSLFEMPLPIAATILTIVFLIALLRIVLLLRACRALSALRKESTSAPEWLDELLADCTKISLLRRRIQVRVSTEITAPALAGFFKPVVLFPQHVIDHLETEEIRQILLHEIAHLKRHDDWMILFQRLLSSFYFFNPCIFWISRQMNLEREIACDASVIDSGDTPQSYALCLTRLAEFSKPMIASPIPSASSQLSRRVEMLLNRSKQNSIKSIAFAICGVIVLAIAALWIMNAGPLLAVTKEKQPVMIAQTDEQNFSSNDEFEDAAQQMKEAQEKMEAAREEMLRAAEAMRKSSDAMHSCEGCEELDLHHEQMENDLELHDREMRENLRSYEKMHRQVQRELRQEETFNNMHPVRPRAEAPVLAPVPPAPPLAEAPPPALAPPATPAPEASPELTPVPEAPLPERPEVPPAPEVAPKPQRPDF